MNLRLVVALSAILVWLVHVAPAARAGVADDLYLFTSSMAPNVAILLDNSGSMNEIVYHPAYDPTKTPTCGAFSNNGLYGYSGTFAYSACGRTRWLYDDGTAPWSMRINGRYLNWLFSPESDPYIGDIENTTNGNRVCVFGSMPAVYAKYQRRRMTAARQVVLDVICQVTASREVRFGMGVFREPRDSHGVDPNGGYLRVGVDQTTASHLSDLESAVTTVEGDTWTPLGESLFQFYTYFMSRNNGQLPPGRFSNTFPKYVYKTSAANGGGEKSSSGPPTVPGSPVQYSCQKNFVIIITDGEPTRDDFDSDPSSTSKGFSKFGNLIGDYNPDGEVEVPGTGYEDAYYLDDIAKYMHETDFRPDLAGDQTLDVYTIGFTTSGSANALLRKTAQQGNGLFFASSNAEELTQAIVASITDIIEKSQSFTAATVPSTRASSGGEFYTSFFLPSSKTALWQGHLRAFGIDGAGNLFDKNGNCPVADPTGGECNSGAFLSSAAPFWDAGEQVPVPTSRKLYTTKLAGSNPVRIAFDSSITGAQLDLLPFSSPPDPAPNASYPGSGASNRDGLAQEIVSHVRGCEFGTGVSGGDVSADKTCLLRPWLLGDIFHSSPVVVGRPSFSSGEPSYHAFVAVHSTRPRVIYAGANDGFLHAFDSGSWNAAATPPGYSRGSGAELFGLMPWEARKQIRNLPIDSPAGRHYYVDGSPQAADVWVYSAPTVGSKAANGSEWRTQLFESMRQGGRGYFAIDVTDPTDGAYPKYLWDFPGEDDPNNTSVATSIMPYLGESWSQPVITRVRVAVNGDDNAGQGYERWVMVVSGGYDPNGDPNAIANYDPLAIEGRAVLMVDATNGELLAMKKYEPGAPAGDPRRDMVYAMPATPAVFDLDGDGFADVIYAGDLGGQIFKWVVHAVGEDRVNDSSAAGNYTQPGWPFKIFFKAPVTNVAGTNYYRSFFFPPSAAYVSGKLWLAIGSGERANLSFAGIAGQDENNRIYVLKEPDPYEMGMPLASTLAETDLTDMTGTQACTSITDPGYYIRLADGEKIVTNSEIFSSLFLAGSFLPDTTGDPCTAKGSGNIYAFDISCGGGFFKDALGNPTRVTALDQGMPTDPQVSVGVDGQDNMVFIEKSGADLESIRAPNIPNGGKSRLYWREIR